MEDDDVRALVRILRRVMLEEHITMQGLARRLGISTSHLSMVLAGKRRPGLRLLWAAMSLSPEVRELVMSRHPERTAPPGRKRPGGA